VGEGDEVFINDYPMKILLSGDLELMPWMVGITSREGGLFLNSEKIYLHTINCCISLIMETERSLSLKRHVFGDRPELVQSNVDQY
jgi:hypothetical protein